MIPVRFSYSGWSSFKFPLLAGGGLVFQQIRKSRVSLDGQYGRCVVVWNQGGMKFCTGENAARFTRTIINTVRSPLNKWCVIGSWPSRTIPLKIFWLFARCLQANAIQSNRIFRRSLTLFDRLSLCIRMMLIDRMSSPFNLVTSSRCFTSTTKIGGWVN